MPEFVNEDCAATATELIFPNVQTCCALIVTSTLNNSIGGYHVTLFSPKWDVDRALLFLKDALGGNVDGVYMVGNVLGRTNLPEGLSYAHPLKQTLTAGLGFNFGVKYRDTGSNHNGVAVRARRDPANNVLRLSYSTPGNWVAAPNVAPGPGLVQVRSTIAAAMDGNTGRRLRITRPATVPTCVLNAETPISTFLMPSF
jgi:hypothetical protein